MKLVIPNLYSEYIRFITTERAIPLVTDCLNRFERRMLIILGSYKGKQLIKSAAIVGDIMRKIHPHGDKSIYDSLVQMARNGFLQTQGNWGRKGGKKDSPASAMRYTECRLHDWVREIVFPYNDKKFIPWDNFYFAEEPLVLPSPIPLGLIGVGLKTGIGGVDRSLIPKYSVESLRDRTKWLLDKTDNIGPQIIPNIDDCTVVEGETGAINKILTKGYGRLTFIPNGSILPCTKVQSPTQQYISVQGRAPNDSFQRLWDSTQKDKKTKEVNLNCTIQEGVKKNNNELLAIMPNEVFNMEELAKHIWNKYLIKSHNISVITTQHDENFKVTDTATVGIDTILQQGYNYWVRTCYGKNYLSCLDSFEEFFKSHVILLLRTLEVGKYNSESEVINVFNKYVQQHGNQSISMETFNFESLKWESYTRNIEESDLIDVMRKKTIRSLVERSVDLQKINDTINDKKLVLNNTQHDCYNILSNLKNK
jgi:hypothetical protein